jgi:hypothetical protein
MTATTAPQENTDTVEADELRRLVCCIAAPGGTAADHAALGRSLGARLSRQARRWLPEPDAGAVATATLDEMRTMARHHLGDDIAVWAGEVAARRITDVLQSRAAGCQRPLSAR